MEWRKIVAVLFIPLAVVILFLGVYFNLWTFHDITLYIVSGLVGGIPLALVFISRPQKQKNVTPVLNYGRIIIRKGTRMEENILILNIFWKLLIQYQTLLRMNVKHSLIYRIQI